MNRRSAVYATAHITRTKRSNDTAEYSAYLAIKLREGDRDGDDEA